MTADIQTNRIVDCEGLACPMPIVKTKKAMEEMTGGEVLEVRATDKGSVVDLQSWAGRTGHHYLGLKEEAGILRHFLRKASDPEKGSGTRQHPAVISNDELNQKLQAGEVFRLLDVREPAEYNFQRIPGAISVPLGTLEEQVDTLPKEETYLVVCRTGSRSDLACQLLAERGYTKVINVVPGMSAWEGPVEWDE